MYLLLSQCFGGVGGAMASKYYGMTCFSPAFVHVHKVAHKNARIHGHEVVHRVVSEDITI